MAGLDQQIVALTAQRQQLRNKSRSIKDDEKLAAFKSEISGLSDELKKLRREVWLCDDIQERSKADKKNLLFDKLSDVLSAEQKESKIKNILTSMKKKA